jgi:hypothetical protein
LDQTELMNYVVDALDRHGIPYAITGSHASSVFGETRFTNDIDVVIQLNSQALLEELLTDFPEGVFYVSEIGARHAVAHGGQFNIIHEDSSQKIDLIVPERTDWPDQLERRTKVAMQPDREIWFVSPEDLILKKMDFYREGGSEKHLRDIAGTLKISGGRVDLEYITTWAGKLGLLEIWNEILGRQSPK